MQRLTPQDNEVNRKVQVNAVVVMADEHVINQAISKQPCLKINPLVLPQGAVQYDQAVFFLVQLHTMLIHRFILQHTVHVNHPTVSATSTTFLCVHLTSVQQDI